MEQIIVSAHAKTRIKERCGVGKGTAERMCILAQERGTEREHTKGALRKWLDSEHRNNCKMMVYGDKTYIISHDGVLVTVLQIPSALTKNMRKMLVPVA